MTWLRSILDKGFAVIPAVFTGADFEPLLAEIGEPGVRRSRAGLRHAMRFESVRALARDERLLGIARKVLGNDSVPFKATLFDKSSTANWLVVWHQDTALPLKQKCEDSGWGPWSVKEGVTYAHAPAGALRQILALRIHLDDSTSFNGPLRVLPETHNLGVLTDAALHDLSIKIEPVDCLVPRGGVLAMRPLLVHASSKTQDDSRRRVLHIEYAETTTMGGRLELAEA